MANQSIFNVDCIVGVSCVDVCCIGNGCVGVGVNVDVDRAEVRCPKCGPEVGGVHINIVVNFEDKAGPGAGGGVQPLE